MPKVIVVATGGTVAHRSGADGVASMDLDIAELISAIPFPIDVELRSVLRKGSMDMVPDDWEIIASAVREAISEGPNGVVVLHGTDTLQYTAAALSFLLGDCGVPVAVTGSMIPGGDSGSDALPNLRDALTIASYADFAEVCVAFSADPERTKGLIIRGCCAKKVHSYAINAFASVNAPLIGTVTGDVISRTSFAAVRPRGPRLANSDTRLDSNVLLIKLTPAVTPEVLTHLLIGPSGIVLEGTGVGHVRSDLHPIIERFGRPVVLSTQALCGGERLGGYQVDRKILDIPNIIPAGRMSSETALVKLMWALGRGGDVPLTMRTDIAGEMGLDLEVAP